MKIYCIKNKNKDYWDNEMGWVDEYDASFFNEREKRTLNLPVGGLRDNVRWVLVYNSEVKNV